MFMTGLSALLLSTLGVQQAETPPEPPAPKVRRVIVRGQLVVRVPVRPRSLPGSTPIYYNLRDGPRCLSSRQIAGAAISGQRSVDFLLADRRRMRVEMSSDCPSLDFYGGFYLQPTDDRLCANRDVIRTRMGGSCKIEKFHLLEARAAR